MSVLLRVDEAGEAIRMLVAVPHMRWRRTPAQGLSPYGDVTASALCALGFALGRALIGGSFDIHESVCYKAVNWGGVI